jgi:acetyl esterase/lipase
VALANLIVAAILAALLLLTYFPFKWDPLTSTSFVVGWLVSELAGQIGAVFVIFVVLLSCFGGFRGHLGLSAFALDLAVVAGLGGLVALGYLARGVVRSALASTPGLPLELTEHQRRPVWGRWWRVLRAVPLPSRDLEVIKNVNYLDDGLKAHRLDVIKSKITTGNAPVLLYVHGGGWVIGDKREQGKPMMYELASRGWVCVTANYRLSPKAIWPDHIIDVKLAIAWVKANIADYGGDPDFVAISGGSAGGQLCALAALTSGDPSFQPGFEEADTSVAACVPIYGVMDMTAQKEVGGRFGPALRILLEKQVMKTTIKERRELFEAASPLHRVHEAAPPFLVLHGTHDTLVPVEVARTFVPALRAVSKEPVAYVELPVAQHGFDVMGSPRCSATTAGVVAFLEAIRARS